MSNARNLADLLDANGDVASGALDNVPPSNDASALTTGTLPIARIADGDITAAKLGSTLDLSGKTVTLPTVSNLTLSGGVYLGGLGAANYLDDYETGTWTPYFTGSTSHTGGSYNAQTGHYVKVGRLVQCRFQVSVATAPTFSGTYLVIAGFPFTVRDSDNDSIGTIPYVTSLGSSPSGVLCYQAWDSEAKAFIFEMDIGTSGRSYPSTSTIGNSTFWAGSLTYMTDS